LVNTVTAPYDLHLKSGSPAISAGATIPPVTTDFDDVSRQGSAYDIGAYEYVSENASPAIALSPTFLDFGNAVVGTSSAVRFITVTNTGGGTLTFSDFTFSGDFSPAGLGTCGVTVTLAADANCTISVKFTPTATGSRTGSVAVTDSAPGSPHTVSFSGVGTSLAP